MRSIFLNLKRKTMKKNLIWGATVAFSALIFSSCQKDDSFSSAPNQTQDLEAARNASVVVPDAPADIARVPLFVSQQFMQGGAHTSYVAPDPSNPNGTAGKGPRTTRDNTPPTVNITSPANGASITGSVTISANATDNVGVTSVAISINGTTMWTWIAAPYSNTWTPSTDGNYTITATAKDAKGNISTHSIVVSRSSTTTGGTGGTGTGTGGTGTPTLPARYVMSTPAPFYQGGEGSCGALAITMQRSIDYYYSSGASSYSNSTNVLSPEFLYNLSKVSGDCGSGTSMIKSLDFTVKRGICKWSSLAYDVYNGCDSSIITSTMKSEAMNFRAPAFRAMLPSDRTAIKTSLAANHPVSFSFTMDSNFAYAPNTPGYIWNSRGTMMSTHALTIIGYDDSINAFRAINGWGSSWGDQGYIWIDYNFFATISSYVYALY